MITQAEIIEVLKMQSILNGTICLLIAVIGACGTYGAYFVIKNGLKSTDADTKRWMATSGAILGVISLSLFCVFLWQGLTRVANPGMQAVEYLVRNAQGKLF
jgi:predicted benzoate:H+ symporter BenE